VLVDAQGQARFLPGQGAPLGAMSVSQYRDFQYRLQPGESLLIASDGLVEAPAPDGKMLGYPGFLQLVQQVVAGSRANLAGDVVAAVKRQSGGGAEFDDVTLLAIHRDATAAPIDGPTPAVTAAGAGVTASTCDA